MEGNIRIRPRIRVAHVLNELRPSGAETMLVSAAPHWGTLGVSCDVIATGTHIGPYAQTLSRAGYGVHHVPVGKLPGGFLRFWRHLRSSDYDVVHQHAEGRGYWLMLTARGAGLPVVRTVHNNFHFTGNLRLRRSLQRRHLRALGVRFIAIAPGVLENERIRFGNTCELIWNWLDLPRFERISESERLAARVRRNIPPSQKVLVSIGNCATTKNHGVIVSAVAELVQRWDLLYLHAGVEDASATERTAAEALGVKDRIEFLGWVQDVRGVMAAADFFVMPSIYEGMSIAALEALAIGLPVLLADVPGLRDLRKIFPSIRYCDPTAPALAKKLEEILSAPMSLTPSQLDEQVDICHKLFAPERGARQYADVYRALFDAKRH